MQTFRQRTLIAAIAALTTVAVASWVLAQPPISNLKSNAVATKSTSPLIVAHRGLLLHAPENTLANFRACLELRIGFEFDVQRTKDGRLVCLHDSTVDRTTNGKGRVADLTFNQIRELDAGQWFDPRFAGQKVPTVEEVLKLIAEYRQHHLLVAVDLKADDVAADVVQMAGQMNILDRLLFIGNTISDPKVRDQIQNASRMAHAASVANDADEFPTALAATNADWVYFRFLPLKFQIEAVHRAGKRAFIAGQTVSGNVPDNWRRTTDAGIDAILTDYPLELRASLRRATVRQ